MESTEYCGYIFTPASKEEKARRELETNRIMSDQAKRKVEELEQELLELDRRRTSIVNRMDQNRREASAYDKRSEKLTQFIALAEEI